MKTSYYFRSPVLNWYELSQEQQQQYPEADYSESLFVFDEKRNDLFSLDNFMSLYRLGTRPGRFHGVYSMGYFSAYYIHLSKCGSAAVVAYRYC